MAVITIQQAAKLTGLDRRTIYRHIKQGRLSRSDDGIDTSELLRVYGAFQQDGVVTPVTVTATTECHTERQIECDLLRQQNELLKAQLDAALDREKRLLAIVEKQAMLLTYQPEPGDSPKKEEPQPIVSTSETIADDQETGLLRTWLKRIW